MDKAGNLYRTSNELCNTGTVGSVVFELIRNDGNWTEKVLYSFSNNSYVPDRDLILDKAGNVWRDHRRWCLQRRHCLQASSRPEWEMDGEGSLQLPGQHRIFIFLPRAPCLRHTATLHGTTSNAVTPVAPMGSATSFELTPYANGKWTGKVLYNFISNGQDGYYPSAGVTLDKNR
jgi:hypothetical protein